VTNSRQPDQYVEGAINLTEGLHDLKIRFLDQSGHSFIDVYWQPPGAPRSLIPGERVFPPMAAYTERAGPLRTDQTPFTIATATAETAAPAAAAPAETAAPAASAGPAIETLPVSPYQVKATFGTKGTGSGESTESRSVAVGPDGSVIVVDSGNKRILVFDSGGKLIRTIGSPGTGDGQFTDPAGAVFDPAGNLLVLDAETAWVQRFSPTGQLDGKFAGPTAGFYHPRGIAVDSAGNVYLADTGTGRIVALNSSGEQVRALGEHGTKLGQLQEPVSVAIAADGSFYVTDPTAKRLSRYDANFQFVTSWEMTPTDTVNAGHVALADDGSVFVTDPANHRIIHLDPNGQPVDQLGGPGTLGRPVGIALDHTGNVFVADSELDQVFEFGQ
jgi:DNA-binding beta-propeller fold protein YncE